jgi:tRNA 5-methylaminomethyl-2-thiouridine biosynthesis bifunctional protein
MNAPASRRVCLQLGFGLGQAFQQSWQQWRLDPDRPRRLDFIAITPCPPGAAALHHVPELSAQWPPPTRNLHRLAFDDGRVHLLLAVGQPLDVLPQLRAQVDDFLIDEFDASADPQRAPLRLAKGLARLAAPLARLRAPPALREALVSVGFELELGSSDLRAMYRPRFTPRRRGATAQPDSERHALIVGAGLAGCATASALAEQGWRCTVIDRADAPATEASGNPAGLFHGIVNPQDGAHARFNRAAALLAQRTVQRAIDSDAVRGNAQGLLRLDTRDLDLQSLRGELAALQLPPDYVQALDAAQASERCGLPLQHPTLFYPGGGWVQPAALARWFLQQAGSTTTFRGGLTVQSLQAAGGRWQLLDASANVIAEAATVVLANAFDALRLLQATHWPVQPVRGQISLCAAAQLQLPPLPVAGAGYLLPDIDGQAVFGASAQPGDSDAAVRESDHQFNLQRLASLSPQKLPSIDRLQGRVGWRCVTADRLPLAGAVPAALAAPAERLDEVPRRPGLYLFSALGSRGIAWSTLGAQVLAAQISGAPVPLEASLVDALDPARFALRAARRAPRG